MEPTPQFVKATRVKFEAAKDRSRFDLTVYTTDNQSIEIEFPGWYAHEFLEQVQNLAARFPKGQTHRPDNTTTLYMVLRDETRILSKTKTRDADLEHVAKSLNGRLSPDDLRRLITAAHTNEGLHSPDGWLRRMIEAATWDEELAHLANGEAR